MSTSTPWGPSQHVERYGPGITWYETASHGGYHVAPTLQAKMPDYLRIEGGWYEEDCDWARVVVFFPERFRGEQVTAADETLKNWAPAAWEAHFRRALVPGESYIRDQELFRERTKTEWVVISAVGDWHQDVPPGMVGCWARLGGSRSPHAIERRFLVPAGEYDARGSGGHFGFVVDVDRHRDWPEGVGV